MPPKKVQGSRKTRRGESSRERTAADVYGELLSEATATLDDSGGVDRPLKRRRTAGRPTVETNLRRVGIDNPEDDGDVSKGQQFAFDDFQTDEESDVDWEDVELDVANEDDAAGEDAPAEDLNLTLARDEPKPTPRRAQRRLPGSALEKKKRLDIHKVHICCLLSHVSRRNHWCNNTVIQKALKPTIGARTRSYLNPKSDMSQFQRSRSFVDGLEQAINAWKTRFKITERGFARPNWIIGDKDIGQLSLSDDAENCLDIADFIRAAEKGEGSRDIGAQLFCAMLRSANVDARLVCSLQPLSFASAPASRTTPQSNKVIVYHPLSDEESDHETDEVSSRASPSRSSLRASGADRETPQRVKRFGKAIDHGEHHDPGKAPLSISKKKRKIVESPYPIYWVEAFNEAIQKWHPVDPIVSCTIAKPNRFEPPASDGLNDMTYVIAFDDEGYAKDVTRRYTKAYNAKTRRNRVEVTKEGETWWKRTLKSFRRKRKLDQDQVEDAELAQKEAAEPMPRNVQDFKNHPYYALERHLRRNEIIHPWKEVGKLSVGKTADAVESIYRRRDVTQLKTADKWYREGREINVGEAPLKRVPARAQKLKSTSPDPFGSDDQDEQDQGLYAIFQTDVYVPPPIVRGRIPKNAFGNLDIYVPSMIPPGGVHIRTPEAAKAARVAGVDYADAVTGFEFRGRKGTAIVKGAIVAKEHQEAVEEIVIALRWQREREEENKRSTEALRLWKRFYAGLKIRERVMTYYVEGEDSDVNMQDEIDHAEEQEEMLAGEGGFVEEEIQRLDPEPIISAKGENEGFSQDVRDLSETSIHPLPSDKLEPSIPSPWDMPGPAARPSELEDGKDLRRRNGFDRDHTTGELSIDNERQAGGFIIDDTEMNSGAVQSKLEPSHKEDLGGGFVTDVPDNANGDEHRAALAEHAAEMHQPSSATRTVDDPGSPPADLDRSQPPAGDQALSPKPARSVDAQASPHGKSENVEQSEHSDSDSLLSHDPSDEDAEPDWLDSELM